MDVLFISIMVGWGGSRWVHGWVNEWSGIIDDGLGGLLCFCHSLLPKLLQILDLIIKNKMAIPSRFSRGVKVGTKEVRTLAEIVNAFGAVGGHLDPQVTWSHISRGPGAEGLRCCRLGECCSRSSPSRAFPICLPRAVRWSSSLLQVK